MGYAHTPHAHTVTHTHTHAQTRTHAHTPLIISKVAQTEQYLLPLVQGTEWEIGDDLSLQLVAGCGLVAMEKEHACVHIILLSVAWVCCKNVLCTCRPVWSMTNIGVVMHNSGRGMSMAGCGPGGPVFSTHVFSTLMPFSSQN